MLCVKLSGVKVSGVKCQVSGVTLLTRMQVLNRLSRSDLLPLHARVNGEVGRDVSARRPT